MGAYEDIISRILIASALGGNQTVRGYNGPMTYTLIRAMFLSHDMKDAMWSVAMTQRLEAGLLRASRAPEVHLLAGQDHSASRERL